MVNLADKELEYLISFTTDIHFLRALLGLIDMQNEQNKFSTPSFEVGNSISEDLSRLLVLERDQKNSYIEAVFQALKEDQVVLVKNLNPNEADGLMSSIAERLGVLNSLKLQAGFASSLGHRENIGTYYMSVNKRTDYQFVAPHSEGSSFTNMQLASFYCYENSTDGGETILMNIDQSCEIWEELREKVKRGKTEKILTPSDIRKIKVLARLDMPEDTLRDTDEILTESEVMPGVKEFDVLAKPRKTYSHLLGKEVNVYWNSIESIDSDSAEQFNCFLRAIKLLKLPASDLQVEQLDDIADCRLRHFGSRYDQLFKNKITHKLQPGDFIILNNLSWCHSVNNWTPGSGVRKVSAAFA